MPKNLSRRHRILVVAMLAGAGIVLLVGWKLLWFLTDDAYISFRYVSNSLRGHGYVWNPPPFRPVEGYTNFLWVLILDGTWRAFGVPPPVSSNYLTLVFAFLTLLVVAAMALRMKLTPSLARYRMALVGLVLLGIVTNRTFLTWSSSGLETAMFNFFLIVWIKFCIEGRAQDRWSTLGLAASAAAIYLTRPDGALFFAATLLILALRWRARAWALARADIVGLLPLLVVPVHLVWRRVTYGEWVPNSYYAKVTRVWPESGLRFALSFVLEYGLWIWLAVFLYVAYRWVRRRTRSGRPTPGGSAVADPEIRHADGPRMPWLPWIAAGALTLHGLFYTLITGGDHFEFRVYSHLIPLALLSFLWMLNAVKARPLRALLLLLGFLLLSWPVPWTHWGLTKDLDTREETHTLFASVSDHWPDVVSWYADVFDRQQAWLVEHYVCTRHQEHKINCEFLKTLFPLRKDGERLSGEGYPVFAFGAVGVVSWVLPNINIIDVHGINDYVIARNPVAPGTFPMMAHDRMAPPGYIECFRPNVELLPGRRVTVTKRDRPLTAADIKACEQRWAALVAR